MKTFTNCAEKKAKQFLNLLQGYTKGIRMTAILILLLMGVSNAWGKTVNGPRIYFDNSSMNMTSTQVYFVVGHNSFSRTYGPMTEIGDTKLLYRDISTETYYNWGDATYVGFIQVGSKWGDGNWGSSNLTNATNYTAANTSWNSFDWQNTYYCKANSKGGAVTIEYKSAGYSGIPKYNATQAAKVRNTTSESYSTVNGNWPATLKLKGTYLSGDGASGRSEISSTKSSDGNDKKVYGAVVTGKITHSYSNLSEDYQFDGWGTSTPAAGNTYEYHITATTTVYAFFTKKHAITFGVHSSGGGSISAKAGSATITSGDKVVGGTSISFTATPNTGYQVEGWYSNSACTTPINNGTNDTYTVTITDGTNVYVKYEEIPEEKFAVTIQTNNANYGTVSPSGSQQVGASGIEIEATAKYGYKFNQWTKTGSVTIEDTSDPTTVIKATGTGTVTATFVEDLATTKWYISGNGNGSGNDLTPGSPFTGWATNGIQMFKKSGHSTEEIYYCTITANTIASSNDHFPFKVYNATTSKYWGNSGYWVTKENNSPTLSSSSGDNMKFRPYLTGTYEFKLDATNASSPVLTVTWPVYNQLRISAANPADATNTGEFDMTGSGTYTVTRSLNANTTYTFKIVYDSEWYGASSGNLTRASSSKTLSTSSNDLTLKTDVAGNYTFTFNGSDKKLTVTYPEAYTITYSRTPTAAADAPTTAPSITSGNYVAAGTNVTFTAKAAKTGYTFKGWYDNNTGAGAALSTNLAYPRTINANTTIYAVYTENEYEVVAIANPAPYGTVTPETATTMSEIGGGNITATAKNGYKFVNWTIKSGTGYFGETGTNTTSTTANTKFRPTADSEVQANFSVVTYTITYNLDGGTNHTDNPDNYTVETPTITLKNPTKTGYTFEGWYTEAGFTNKVTEIATGSTGNKIFYAKWTENTVTISPTNAYDHGNPGYANPTASNSGKIGISSTSQLVAPSPGEGYTFVGWTLSDNIVVTNGNASSSRTITVRHKTGDGSAVSAVANYNENLDSHWHLVGDDGYVFPDQWGVSNNNKMQKRSGYSSEKKVYMTITVSEIKTYEFKVVDDNGNNNDIWYGYSSGNNFLEWTETSTKDVYTTTHEYNNDNNLKFTPNAVGDYEFKVDYSGNNPKVTITYPEVGSVSSYRLVGDWGNGWDATGIAFNAEGKVSLELEKRERPDYTFKVKASNGKHYTAADEHKRQFTRQHNIETISDDTDYPVDDPHNLQLQADAKGTYIFEFDPATKQLKVTHPEREDGAYLVGDFSDGEAGITDPDDSGKDWTEEYGETFDSNDDCTHGVVEVCDWGEENVTLNFKIKINGIWYGFYHEEDADPLNITTSGTYTLEDQYAYLSASNVQLTTNGQEGCYYFEYTVNPDGTLSVLIIFPNDRRTVTFEMQGHGTQVESQHVLYNKTAVKPYVSDVEGYLFAGWYTDAACTKEYDFNTPVTKDITLYAKWVPYSECIFFKDNLNWDNIYIYTFSDNVWHNGDNNDDPDDDKGVQPKVNRIEYGKMTQIGYTDIYYYALTNLEGFNHIAFSDHDMHDYDDYFHNHSGIYRSDRSDKMQLFIPQKEQTAKTHNNTEYYSEGIWMKYNDKYSGYDWSGQTGGSSNWSDKQLTSDLAGGYSFTAEVELTANQNYEFKIKNLNNTWYGNTGTMTQDNCTDWWFTENTDNAKITPTVTDTYIFTVYLGDGKVMVSLDYPLSVGDYRLAYLDKTANSFHPGHYIKKRNTSKNDTVSFFIHHDNEPQVIAQRCTAIDNNGNAKWETITQVNPAASITETGVYNFTLQQIEGRNDPLLLNQARPYTGNYYIRTDAAPGGWKSFRQEGNMMTYNSYADNNEDFDHYFCEWVSQEKGLKNVKYTVANDYSYCISDTLSDDIDSNHPKIVTNTEGDLPKDNKGNLMNANVRWGWDSKTNKIRRAYIAGSGHKKDRFLVLEGNESLLDVNGKRFTGNTAEGQDRYNLKDDEVVFDDMGNWIYQIDVKANKDTKIDLTAKYNNLVQYFKGGSEEEDDIQLIVTTAGNTNYYKMRLIYDFKINKLIIAWLPEDEVDNQELEVNMMIIRHNQEKAQQVNFKQGAKLSGIETAYAVMTFDKYFLNNKDSKTGAALPQANEKSENERKFYWVSFPFDVKLSDVFGFGEYGDYWIMEYYDGAGRAEQGYWAETETFWKYITNKNYILKAGQGYVLYLNLNKMKFESNVFAHTSEVSLYFPSLSLPNVISGDLPTAVDVPEHTCTIERDNRNIYDSNWNLIGVPGFADISGVTIGDTHHKELNKELNADCVSFYYKYLPGTNTYSATTQTETFQTMYAYMVQFAGTINWQAKTMPAQLAARRTGSTPSQYDLRLELAQGEETDQTFVQLKEADATAEFDMNVDMTKIFNSGMNIYTLTGSNAIQVAGNAIPMGKATVPVGVRVDAAGEYTFRMPDGTDGIAVTLVDNATGTHTNMLMSEYTVTLNAGTIENRFYLVVDPDRTATSVENVGEEADKSKGVEKFLIDGKLFIRTADGIFDAKGQRL
ncbi:MAG: InlB B-repeat-containing protein [Paludibacteraceae bacterium]|nr:InlB B-repeat-containing protein [Paludibacteraceae bacterium]